MLSALFAQVILFHGLLAYAQSSFSLGYIPLAVKTPYLNGWIASNAGSAPGHVWPNFYTTDREFGWAGFIRVDNQPFQWMGNSPGSNFTTTLSSSITPTKTIFTIQAGPMKFNVTFLTPIEASTLKRALPNDFVRQSLPFSYMYIDGFAANDSQPHLVQVYSDISAQWVARDDATQVVWDTIESNSIVYHKVLRKSPQSMVDNNNMAEDGTGYYAMQKRSGFTWQTCADVDCRGRFSTNGGLGDTKDTNFRSVSQNWPVFGFAVDLGTISPGSQPDPVVAALGLIRDPLVTYTTESVVQSRTGFYMSQHSTPDDAVNAFLSDFKAAQQRNTDLDNKIMSAANSVSSEYAGILALATRQLFASMDITIPSATGGSFDTSDVKIFMKDMGTSVRANPVEVIYGAFPALLYFNPSLAANLLKPLFEFQSSSSYNNPYAAPDLGSVYPVVLGNSSDTHVLGVESTGSMLIMAYAHAVKSGDGSLLNRYYSTLQKWADYLVTNAIHPPMGSISADSTNGAALSNLALKGILGIYSMGKINEALKVSNTTYMDQANQLISQWKGLAVSNNQIHSVYSQPSSWGMIYNIFPAVWLGMGLIDNDTINNQAQFYAQQTASQFGFPLDSSNPDSVFPHWILMTAATIPSGLSSIQNKFIDSIYQHIYTNTNKFPLPEAYKASTGDRLYGSGSAIHGAAFSLLALNLPNVAIKANAINNGSSKKNVGAIVGGVIGGLAGLLAITFATFFIWRHHKRKQQHRKQQTFDTIDEDLSTKPQPFTGVLVPPLTLPTPHTYQVVNNNDSTAQLFNTNAPLSPTRWSPGWDGMSQSRQGGGSDAGTTTTSSLPPGAAAAAPPMSSKQREALGLRLTYGHVAAPSESALSTLSNPYSASASASGTEELRVEVEQLRREMDSIRHMAEPPPGYQ